MRDTTINADYFNEINTFNKAYIAGFIAADGAIVANKNSNCKVLTVTIHSKDVAVLELMKSEMNSALSIKNITKGGKSSYLQVVDHKRFTTGNKKIISALDVIGIKPRKSLTMPDIIKNIPKDFRKSFILGYFDGDGCFSDSKIIRTRTYLKKDGSSSIYRGYKYNSQISIKGTFEFLEGIVKELNITNYSLKQLKDQNIHTLTIIKNSEILKFYDCYNYCDFFFVRKKDKFTRKIIQVQTISSPQL